MSVIWCSSVSRVPCPNHGPKGSCVKCLSRDIIRIKQQEKPTISGVSFSHKAAEMFQEYVRDFGFSVQRVGILYGNVDEAGWVNVEVIFEPSQEASANNCLVISTPQDESLVDSLASLLGLEVWISHFTWTFYFVNWWRTTASWLHRSTYELRSHAIFWRDYASSRVIEEDTSQNFRCCYSFVYVAPSSALYIHYFFFFAYFVSHKSGRRRSDPIWSFSDIRSIHRALRWWTFPSSWRTQICEVQSNSSQQSTTLTVLN